MRNSGWSIVGIHQSRSVTLSRIAGKTPGVGIEFVTIRPDSPNELENLIWTKKRQSKQKLFWFIIRNPLVQVNYLSINLVQRARSVKAAPIPSLRANSAIAIIPLAIFWLNAIGFPFGPSLEPYAIAITAFLFLTWWIFKQNPGVFIQPSSPGS